MSWLQRFIAWLFKEKSAPVVPPVIEPTPVPTPPPAPIVVPKTPLEILYDVAVSYLGKDPSPADIANDALSCAESVFCILVEAFDDIPHKKGVVSTTVLDNMLRVHPKFNRTLTPKKGVIISSPSGSGNGALEHGHVGIFYDDDTIMSINSRTGLFERNYTLPQWVARYRTIGGFKINFYERSEA